MNTTAIRQAIKLYQQPVELAEIMAVNAALPTGITDLLRLCASEKLLQTFCDERDIDSEMLYNILTHYIEKVLFKEGNTPFKILGIDKNTDQILSHSNKSKNTLARQHHQLLMKIYHPDRNRSSSSAYYASKISKAYEAVKQTNAQSRNVSAYDNAQRLYDEPPQSFYQATRKAQLQLNRTRNTFFGISALIVAFLVFTALLFNQPDSSGLIVRNQITDSPFTTATASVSSDSVITNVISHAGLTAAIQTSEQISASKMQSLLHELETAYEQGEVGKIKPILANTPEMSQQSDASLNAKLETLFKITQERKMVLYDFTWQNLAGDIHGEGKFLSRFLLSGQDEWQTRTGIATIKAEINDNKVKITQLEMNDIADQHADQQ